MELSLEGYILPSQGHLSYQRAGAELWNNQPMGDFAANLTRLMRERRITAKALSRKAGLNPTAVRDILTGRSKNPRSSTLFGLAAALRCDVSDLVGEERLRLGPKPTLGDHAPIDRAVLFRAADLLVKWLEEERLKLPHREFLRAAIAVHDHIKLREQTVSTKDQDLSDIIPFLRLSIHDDAT